MYYTTYLQHEMKLRLVIRTFFQKTKCVEGNYSAMEESSKDFQELEEFPKHVEIYEDVATSNTRNIDQIITYKIAQANLTSIKEESEEEEKDDIIQFIPVTYALDRVDELRRLIGSFDSADKMLH